MTYRSVKLKKKKFPPEYKKMAWERGLNVGRGGLSYLILVATASTGGGVKSFK